MVLALSNLHINSFEVEIDASVYVMGEVLMQEGYQYTIIQSYTMEKYGTMLHMERNSMPWFM